MIIPGASRQSKSVNKQIKPTAFRFLSHPSGKSQNKMQRERSIKDKIQKQQLLVFHCHPFATGSD